MIAGEDERVSSTDKGSEKQRPASYFSPLLSGGPQGGLGGEQDPQVWVGPGVLLRPQEGHGARGTPGSEELKHLHDRASWEQKSSQTSAPHL